jgi:predicted nuclease of predicted toxin-antitoxin system
MKLLLDECVPHRFRWSLSSGVHECLTVPEAGFAGKTNGELLSLAEGDFGVFITLDKGFAYQQNLKGRSIGVIVIRAKSARLADLLPHAEACLAAIAVIKPGEVIQIGN